MNLNKLVPERKKVNDTTDFLSLKENAEFIGYNQAIDDMEANIAKAKVGLDVEEAEKIIHRVRWQRGYDCISKGTNFDDVEKSIAQALADKAEKLITINMEGIDDIS